MMQKVQKPLKSIAQISSCELNYMIYTNDTALYYTILVLYNTLIP